MEAKVRHDDGMMARDGSGKRMVCQENVFKVNVAVLKSTSTRANAADAGIEGVAVDGLGKFMWNALKQGGNRLGQGVSEGAEINVYIELISNRTTLILDKRNQGGKWKRDLERKK
ncbi:predicted protein [Histoplasma capsulatum var. duboisii H88]|uniref:Predicted protein n=1 Tax=Ajellomyces capsulatus (strain H88) TaxID=544711 RepID=F0U8N3_AJEC8|nr:predicted protein [Histoplasma capsulatum var. duboisii H88]